MKTTLRLLLILAVIGISFLTMKTSPAKAAINGSIEYAGSQRILNLWGTNYEMGYAHGYLLGDEIQSRIQWEINQGVSTYNSNLSYTNTNFLMYPDYNNEIAGIAQGIIDSGHGSLTGVNRNVNTSDILLLQEEADRWFYCSSFGVWSTTDGKTIVGRNFDEPMSLTPLQVMIVREPATGTKTVSWSLIGLAGIHCGINEEGITVSANWGGNNQWTSGPFYLTHLVNRYMLEKTTPANFSTQPLALINGLPQMSAVNWQIGSPTSSYVIEDADTDVVRNATNYSHIVTTNHQLSNNNGQYDDGSHDRYNTINNGLINLYNSGDKVVSSAEAWAVIASVAWARDGEGTICTILLRPNDRSFDVAYSDGTKAATASTVTTYTWNQLFPNHASGPNTPPAAANDSYNANQNGVLNVSAPGVLANDTDSDGNSLTASLLTNAAHGSLTLNPNGSFTYTPTAGFSGSDSFTYRAYDNQDYSNDATAVITVKPNTPPVAANETYSVNQKGVLTVSAPGVLSNDTDADGDTLTAVLVSGAAHGTLTLNSNGSFTYTPAASYAGSDSFAYHAYDSKAYSNTATVSITITAGNSPPVASKDSYSTSEDTPLNTSAPGVLSNDSDPNGKVLTAIKVTNPSHGTLTLNSNGSFIYTPAANYNGSDTFTYKANDSISDSSAATVTFTISPVNDPPTATNDTYSTSVNTTLNISAPGVLANDTDADNTNLTAIKVSNPSHGSVTLNSNGSFAYIPAANFTGSDSFTYKANDGLGDSNIATVTINIAQSSSQSTFGLNSGDGKDTYTSDQTLTAMRFQNTAGAGILTKLEILFDDTNPHGQVRMGVYADNNGKPGALLLDAGQVAVANGWVSISGLNLPVTANTYYWLVFDLQRQNGVKIQSGTPQNSLAYRYIGSYGALPSSFPNPDGYYNAEYVMRATVKSGG